MNAFDFCVEGACVHTTPGAFLCPYRDSAWYTVAPLAIRSANKASQYDMNILTELPFVRMAHRGASGYLPENTVPALERALSQGTDALDVDVRLSKDGHLVVCHDASVDRTTNGTGRITDLTLAELRALDAGWWSPHCGEDNRGQGYVIPTLEEVLELDDGEIAWNLDVKDHHAACVNEVVALIRSHGLVGRVMISSSNVKVVRLIRSRIPEVTTTLGRSEVIAFYRLHLGIAQEGFETPDNTVLQIPEYATPPNGDRMYLPTEGAIESAHEMGLRVFIATVNDRDAMGSLCRAGVDGIYTDFPDRLNTVLRAPDLLART